METTEMAQLLAHLPGLQQSPAFEREGLARQFDHRTVGANVTLGEEGQRADEMYVLLSGTIGVRKRSAKGRTYDLADIEPVALLGHAGVVTHSPRTATLVTNEPCEMLVMSRLRASLFLRSDDYELIAPFRRALIIALSRQLGEANALITSLAIRAGVAEPIDTEPFTARVPEDAEESLLRAQSKL